MTAEILDGDWEGEFIFPVNRLRQWENEAGWRKRGKRNLVPVVFEWDKTVSGWSTGPMLCYSAAFLGCVKVYLLGFDMGYTPREGLMNNIYKDSPNYRRSKDPTTVTTNWVKQFGILVQEFPDVDFAQLGEHTLDEFGVRAASWEELSMLGVGS